MNIDYFKKKHMDLEKELVEYQIWYKNYVPIGTQKSYEELVSDYMIYKSKSKDVKAVVNREFKAILKTYSSFTHSDRNKLVFEVSGVENYVGNTLKVGDEVNIQHKLK